MAKKPMKPGMVPVRDEDEARLLYGAGLLYIGNRAGWNSVPVTSLHSQYMRRALGHLARNGNLFVRLEE